MSDPFAFFVGPLFVGLTLLSASGLPTVQEEPRPKSPIRIIEPSEATEPTYEAAGVVVQPFVLHRTDRELQISWRTAKREASELLFHKAKGSEPDGRQDGGKETDGKERNGLLDSVSYPTEVGYQHKVILRELAPDTTYMVTVGGHWAQRVSTLPAEMNRRFAVIGHTHGSERMDQYPDELLAAQIEGYRPDFVVHAGDCVFFAEPAEWKRFFFRLFRSTLRRAPMYVAPGNHDSGMPFLDGYDMRCFREIFAFDYPANVGAGPEDAFYRIQQGPIEFYFLSYVADMGRDSNQMRWLQSQLAEGNEDSSEDTKTAFRVVVFGGANDFYDRNKVIKKLGEWPIDLVINGDGGAPEDWFSRPHGLTRAVTGTAGSAPRPWLACTANANWMTLTLMRCDGSVGETHWIHSQRRRAEHRELKHPMIDRTDYWMQVSYDLPEANVTSAVDTAGVGGVQVQLKGDSLGKGICTVNLETVSGMKGRESGYTIENAYFDEQDKLLTFTFPKNRPMHQGPLHLRRIHIRFVGMPPEHSLEVEAAWLFARKSSE